MSSALSGWQAYEKGKAEKKAYDANADTLRAQSAANLSIAADQMATMRGQQQQAQASARARQGATGLTSEGTAIAQEVQVANEWEVKLAETQRSSAQADINTRHEAAMQNYQGAMAKAQGKQSFTTGLVMTGIQIGVGALTGGFGAGAASSATSSAFSTSGAFFGGLGGAIR